MRLSVFLIPETTARRRKKTRTSPRMTPAAAAAAAAPARCSRVAAKSCLFNFYLFAIYFKLQIELKEIKRNSLDSYFCYFSRILAASVHALLLVCFQTPQKDRSIFSFISFQVRRGVLAAEILFHDNCFLKITDIRRS